ncbi:MAG: acetate kinase [Ruminococcaceae bacterium]|nr:acetate kinase [Oscillospiraceae bacterium]
MKILVINAGSSSLKYQLIDMEGEIVLAKGICERIGLEDGIFTHKANGNAWTTYPVMKNQTEAFAQVKKALTEGEGKVINDLSEVGAIGHRVVQGGDRFDRSVVVTEKVKKDIEELAALAPLHNMGALAGINAATETFGEEITQVVVFDTAFHQTMEPKVFMFALPYEYYEKYGVRRYGAHGTSHRFVSARCCELLGKVEGTRIITCHLGSGSSISAIKDGKILDTSMGLTPLDGFMMGTRTGGFDPSAVTYIMDKEGLTPKQMDDLMNKKSGTLGISGVSSDDRDIEKAIEEGNERAKLAWDMRTYQITKIVGGYVAALGGLDALVFTAGIGENQPLIREEIVNALSYLGMKFDPEANNCRGVERRITTEDSAIPAYIIPTNEELVIARDTLALAQ